MADWPEMQMERRGIAGRPVRVALDETKPHHPFGKLMRYLPASTVEEGEKAVEEKLRVAEQAGDEWLEERDKAEAQLKEAVEALKAIGRGEVPGTTFEDADLVSAFATDALARLTSEDSEGEGR